MYCVTADELRVGGGLAPLLLLMLFEELLQGSCLKLDDNKWGKKLTFYQTKRTVTNKQIFCDLFITKSLAMFSTQIFGL